MVRKFLLAATSVALIAMSSFAQLYPENARINALGGSFIVDDPSDILRYSAYMNEYTNDFQLSYNGVNGSPIFGVKSFNETFNLGLILNQRLMVNNPAGANFYDESATILKTLDDQIAGLVKTQSFPHVLLGFNLKPVKIGVDLFYEYSHYRKTIEDDPSAGNGTDQEVKGNVNNLGFIASVASTNENFPIAIKFGLGWPRASGSQEVTTTNTVTREVKSKKGMFMNGGAELGFTTSALKWTTGLDYIHNHFQFQDAAGVKRDNYFFNNLAAYIGFNADIDANSFVTVLYDFQLRNDGHGPDKEAYAAANRTYSTNRINNILSAGYENTWAKAWIFDKFVLRTGLNYVISTQIDHVKGDGEGGSYKSRVKHETVYNQISPKIGLGIAKKVFSMDVTVDPANWAGIMDGPDVVIVTATLNF